MKNAWSWQIGNFLWKYHLDSQLFIEKEHLDKCSATALWKLHWVYHAMSTSHIMLCGCSSFITYCLHGLISPICLAWRGEDCMVKLCSCQSSSWFKFSKRCIISAFLSAQQLFWPLIFEGITWHGIWNVETNFFSETKWIVCRKQEQLQEGLNSNCVLYNFEDLKGKEEAKEPICSTRCTLGVSVRLIWSY